MIDRFQSTGLIWSLIICLIGISWIINGVSRIRQKRSFVADTDSKFRWMRPKLMTGKNAVIDGRIQIGFGVFLLIMGLLPMLSLFF
jgi:hypothetical protein